MNELSSVGLSFSHSSIINTQAEGGLVKYALLIYQAEELLDHRSENDRKAELAAHHQLQEKAKAAHALVTTNELMLSSTATTVRERAGKTLILDGPFAETKEQLTGIYVLDCQNLDEAIAYAKMIPSVAVGSIEIRPLAHFESQSAG